MNYPSPSALVPRTYWLQSRTSNVIICCWLLLMASQDWWPVLFGSKKPTLQNCLFPLFYVLLAGMSCVLTFRSFIRLSEDSITVSRVWGSKTLPFAKIKGRRRYTEKADPYSTPQRHLVLESNDECFPRLDIKPAPELDESFYHWFDSLLDLDKSDGIEEPRSKYANFSLV